MIKIEETEVLGWRAALRGMRNPMNSWDKADTKYLCWMYCKTHAEMELADMCGSVAPIIGPNDMKLAKQLANAGDDHGKFLRMINVYCDITAPLYWWKEYDTYKVGTVANSCSTMHKIQAKKFELDDFSHEHLSTYNCAIFKEIIDALNRSRDEFNLSKLKHNWWQMIQLLPSSYNQKRTVQMNYAVLRNMYHARKNHKLDEWHEFCAWVETLPYAKELIIGE